MNPVVRELARKRVQLLIAEYGVEVGEIMQKELAKRRSRCTCTHESAYHGFGDGCCFSPGCFCEEYCLAK